MAELNFDAEKVEPNTGSLDPVPAGDYIGMFVDSEFKATKNQAGEYLQLVAEIVEGPHRGRRLFERLNLKNQNETAVKIAEGTLSAICRSVNVMRPKDSAELHNKPFLMSVVVEERNDKAGTFSNKIHSYKAANAAPTASATTAPTAQAGTPPWKRKSA